MHFEKVKNLNKWIKDIENKFNTMCDNSFKSRKSDDVVGLNNNEGKKVYFKLIITYCPVCAMKCKSKHFKSN